VKDIFARPTVGMLAEGLPRLEGETVAIAAPDPGYVALTPIERQFLEDGSPFSRFHQAIAVEVPLGMTQERVRAALNDLIFHHDALRLRVVMRSPITDYNDGIDVGGVTTKSAIEALSSTARGPELLKGLGLWLDPPHTYQLKLDILDISHLSPEAGAMEIQSAARDLPGKLDPVQGRMVAGVWIERSKAGASSDRPLLLLAIHHLSVDGVSWRILLEDLEHATSGRILPTRTHSIRDWSDYLVKEASSPKRRDELATWKAVVSGAGLLPCDAQLSKEKNVIGAMRHYESSLASVEMERLFASTSVYRTGIDDLLLTALGLALYGWRRDYYGREDGALLVDLEGHGREVGESGLDLSRTVGWFTSVYPVRLDFDGI
ncbi:MAG: condensation domain-containing protein, partial [Methylocystis sp.]